MRQYSITTEIEAPAERVWQVVSDTDRWHEWTPSVTSIERLDHGPFAVGSRMLIRQPKLPVALWTVSAIEPGRSVTWINSAPGVRVIAHHAVESVGRSSRATLSIDMQGIFGGVVGWLTGKITQQYLVLEAKGLNARSKDPAFRHDAPQIER